MAYSKAKVDWAGRFFADQIRLAVAGKRKVGEQIEQVEEAVDAIEWWRREHSKPLSIVAANLRHYVAEEGDPVVSQRLKRVPTIAGKLVRETGRLTQMEDIGGVRAVVPDQDAAYRVATRLRKNWTITRFRDYVDKPKPDGYRALHLINRNRGRSVEVQLRTPNQDLWANTVERAARRFPGLKSGTGGPPEMRDVFRSAGDLIAIEDQGLELDRALLSEFQEKARRADTFLDELLHEP